MTGRDPHDAVRRRHPDVEQDAMLAGDGHWLPSLLDENIAVCNPLDGEEPSHLAERTASAGQYLFDVEGNHD